VTDESAATREQDQPPRQQRRGRKIAMGQAELDAFLAEQRTSRVETVGEAPRAGLPEPRLDEPERLFAGKYLGGDVMQHDGGHAWLRLVPDKVTSWDFRLLNRAQRTTS
jgi:hypothetical protein